MSLIAMIDASLPRQPMFESQFSDDVGRLVEAARELHVQRRRRLRLRRQDRVTCVVHVAAGVQDAMAATGLRVAEELAEPEVVDER